MKLFDMPDAAAHDAATILYQHANKLSSKLDNLKPGKRKTEVTAEWRKAHDAYMAFTSAMGVGKRIDHLNRAQVRS